MSTKSLISKYSGVLESMEKDAAANLQEAQNGLNQRMEEQKEAKRGLKVLKDTMQENHRGFLAAAKAILGMVYKRPESPEEIDKVLEPIMGYQAALAAVPAAKEACIEAAEAEYAAERELDMATYLFDTLREVQNPMNGIPEDV